MDNQQDDFPPFFQASPWIESDRELLIHYFTDCPCRTFPKGHIFYSQDENTDYVYLIRSGRVCFSLDNTNGDTKSIFIADKGFIFGKLSSFDMLPNSCFAIVVSASADVSIIPKDVFSALISKDTKFCHEIIVMMSRTIRTLISEIRVLTFSSSRAKVNYALYHLIKQYSSEDEDGVTINMTFTHQEVGELVGLSRVSVTHILSQMVKDGILEKKGGYYHIKNKESIYKMIADDEFRSFDQ